MLLHNTLNSWQALSVESNTELSFQPVGLARIGELELGVSKPRAYCPEPWVNQAVSL